ncbi:serine-rich adhesin for platelets [Daktulosphaira vitifoliae]|uniref:serine-rich adhesin for platelets n=1 Tax=Daktulosphaira vitifoliae TaxID=58002 RepID=UPI0021AA9685|nr:serine-rich adhesin for platelets [Daktulosphaira vitifoliae]
MATATGAKDFVTVVKVDGVRSSRADDTFVTVLSIGENAQETYQELQQPTAEEVLVYRLPGERLGFGLQFDGVETCNRLFVQSCADGSPASRTQASWGALAPGDEIIRINDRPVNRMSRDDCVRCLKESGLVVKLHMVDGRFAVKAPPPVPPRKQKKPEPAPIASSIYTNAVERFVYHGESESDDTNSSVSTVVSKCPTYKMPDNDPSKNCVLDRVLEPFMQLEREFSSSAAIGDDVGLYEKLVAVAEENHRMPPKPLPRKEVRPKKKPPPPPPPLPTEPPPPSYRLPPELVDYVHKNEQEQNVCDTEIMKFVKPEPATRITCQNSIDNVSKEIIDNAEKHFQLKKEIQKENTMDVATDLNSTFCNYGPERFYTGRSESMKTSYHELTECTEESKRHMMNGFKSSTDETCGNSVRDKIALFSSKAAADKKDSISSSSSAYSSGSPDSSPLSTPPVSARSTLPRDLSANSRPQQQLQRQKSDFQTQTVETATSKAPLSRAISFTDAQYHRQTQILVEPYSKYFSTMNTYAEMGRSSLNTLIEQRRRSMSKLRGLVIPEKANVSDRDPTIPDLPEIKSVDSVDTSVVNTCKPVLCPPTKTYVNRPITGTVTRYVSPVKTIQTTLSQPIATIVTVDEQHSSSSSSLNSSREELRNIIQDERPRRTDSITALSKSKAAVFKGDSDEDSALSSSRSSISQYSPTSSPSPNRCIMTADEKSNKRILKAESVEAINRKNVLCSARNSSGKPEPPISPPSKQNAMYRQSQQQTNELLWSFDPVRPSNNNNKTDYYALEASVNDKQSRVKSKYTHNRMSSMESTTSEESSMQYVSTEQFGSISSLASSTSLISQQELQQLIEDANQTLEESAVTSTQSVEVMVVILHRDSATSSVGITLAGGVDYETKEITVYKVLAGSPADRDGRIRKGDRILSINGKSMKGMTHRESLVTLKAPRSEVVLVISRCKSDANFESNGLPQLTEVPNSHENKIETSSSRSFGPLVKVILSKDGSGLGFSLEGGKNSPNGDQPLTVKKIFTGGCAEQCGQIFAGDELMSVNDIDVTGMSRTEAWNLMKRLVNGTVTLGIRHVI